MAPYEIGPPPPLLAKTPTPSLTDGWISFLNLPVAPFQLDSGYDLEDVDRDDAESLGLLNSDTRPPPLEVDVDLADLRRRLAAALALVI